MAPRLPISYRAGYFSFAAQPMPSRQLDTSNMADFDVALGGAPCFLSCLSAKRPDRSPLRPRATGPTLVWLSQSDMLFLLSFLAVFPRLYLSLVCLRLLALSGLSPFVFS